MHPRGGPLLFPAGNGRKRKRGEGTVGGVVHAEDLHGLGHAHAGGQQRVEDERGAPVGLAEDGVDGAAPREVRDVREDVRLRRVGAANRDDAIVRQRHVRFGQGGAKAREAPLSDPFGGRTVADLLRGKVRERLVPVGRLDKDSEGLLLLSNDGALVNRLTHPRFEHEKIYIVRAAGRWSDEKLRVLRGPVEMPDGYVTRPVPVEVVRLGDDNVHVLCFHLREGRKRQNRYMCSAAHLVVLSLKRVAIGALRLPDDLKPGEWRDLSSAQIESALSHESRRKTIWPT